ncbi:unnamed protein product [Vitrella brassicaformis CCMP3155]|uniref:PHD-type domain-containing protein n=1 Tax=Vitrella brassicaformis (strain CCMP3155) TaxID=1169540 RepID=A0A0G4EGK1_VITBC|nr:unnamed protein product [Vitrella brassicaformis CCMP3155]|eukprot:CEL94559.1 unnamed protein product [Vitrella brassicaformis CCMP3155]
MEEQQEVDPTLVRWMKGHQGTKCSNILCNADEDHPPGENEPTLLNLKNVGGFVDRRHLPPGGRKDSKNVYCSQCYKSYKEKRYCPFCYQIVFEEYPDEDGNPWVGCNFCERWCHQKCLEADLAKCIVVGERRESIDPLSDEFVWKCKQCQSQMEAYKSQRRVLPVDTSSADTNQKHYKHLWDRMAIPEDLKKRINQDWEMVQDGKVPLLPAPISVYDIILDFQKQQHDKARGTSDDDDSADGESRMDVERERRSVRHTKGRQQGHPIWDRKVDTSILERHLDGDSEFEPNKRQRLEAPAAAAAAASDTQAAAPAPAAAAAAAAASPAGGGSQLSMPKTEASQTVLVDFAAAVEWYFDTYFESHLVTEDEMAYVKAVFTRIRDNYLANQDTGAHGQSEGGESPVSPQRAGSGSVREDFPKPSEVAGGIYLLRLFVRLPKMLAAAPRAVLEEGAMANVMDRCRLFLAWLQEPRNRRRFFQPKKDAYATVEEAMDKLDKTMPQQMNTS